MVNYSNGKIYKIEPIVEHPEEDIYIGSTTKKYLSQRMDTHRNDYKKWKNGNNKKTTSFNLFNKYGIENCNIILLENVNATNKDELLSREGYYIRKLKCVNKFLPNRTKEETLERIKQYNKIRIKCDLCDCLINKIDLKKHNNTNKHLLNEINQIEKLIKEKKDKLNQDEKEITNIQK
jgi:hypothetical protein